ncbi:MAG TPA: tetratricopeptide repeat protein [Candidatus Dormibacteraeota bacterium]|nr:tetratricopeptide repeat protein [Candidatus Dormibacteraeota bacterium]
MRKVPQNELKEAMDAFARGDMTVALPRLRSAAEAVANGTSSRSEILERLGSVLARTGRFAEADNTLTEAVDAAKTAGERGAELRALIERLIWRLETRRATENEAVDLARIAIPEFERLGDELGLAKAWHLLGDEHVGSSWAAGTEALERALLHARRSGDQREIGDVMWWLGVTYHFGPTPVDEAIRRCEELRRKAPNHDRTVEAGTLGVLAGLTAMQGRFSEARTLFAQGLTILQELGLTLRMATRRTISGAIELLADEPVAAERELRWGYDRLEAMGERADQGGIGAQLGEALYRQGRYDEAERYAVRDVRAKLLARRGDFNAAETLAREAVVSADEEDNLNRRGNVRVALAEVLSLAERKAEAIGVLVEAHALFREKGNVAAMARTATSRVALL